MASDPAKPVDVHAVMELRERTGMGVMQCKLILAEAGSVEIAMRWLQERRPLPEFVSASEPCSACRGPLRFPRQMECPNCDWLRVPPVNREAWGKTGPCPACGLTYRWDGVRCSHCGHGNIG